MNKYQNLFLSVGFFTILIFEIIVYKSIILHPYMVTLCLFLLVFGCYNLAQFVHKNYVEDITKDLELIAFAKWIGDNNYSKHQVNDRWYDNGIFIGTTEEILELFRNSLPYSY